MREGVFLQLSYRSVRLGKMTPDNGFPDTSGFRTSGAQEPVAGNMPPAGPAGPFAAAGIPFANNAAANTDATFSEALQTLRKRKLVVLALVTLGILYGLYKALTQVPLYEAFGRIEVRSGSSDEFKMSSVSFFGDDPQRKLSTEEAILESDTLLATVAQHLNLENNAEFFGVKGPMPHHNMDDPGMRQKVVAQLQANLKVAIVPKTDIMRISYSSLNPKLSADIVNRLIADYVHRSYETRFNSTQQVSQWLSSQLDDLKRKVEASQEQMMDLQKKLGTLGFDSTHSQITASLDDLVKAAADAKLARILAESRYRLLSGMDPNSLEGSLDTVPGAPEPELNTLRTNLATARANYAHMTTLLKMGPNLPQVLAAKAEMEELTKEISAEESRLLTQGKAAFELAKANEQQTTAALEQQKADAYRLRDDLVEYTIRQREFESSRTLYEGLLQKLQTAGVEAGLESLEVDIVDAAVVPSDPILVPRSRLVLTYFAIGLVLGVLTAFALESMDTGLRSIAEIETVTDLPSMAIGRRALRASREQLAAMSTVERNLQVLTQPKSQFTEAFRSLRTALLLSSSGREPKFILCTSATPSEGKTTAATNLAVILAQRGTRVLLMDADLRRPNVHHRFGLNGKLGLSTVLSGQTTLEQSVQQIAEVPGLDVLASGPVPPFPTEMLSSQTMSDLLKKAGEIYTYVVLDSPPVLSVTDGVLLSRQVDAVVLVVRHGKSSKHIIRRGRDLLVRSGAPLAGIVLNAVDLNAPEYYGYYGYSGYSYSSLDAAGWETQDGSRAGNAAKSRRKGTTDEG